MLHAPHHPRRFARQLDAGLLAESESAARIRKECRSPTFNPIWIAPMLLEFASTSAMRQRPNSRCAS